MRSGWSSDGYGLDSNVRRLWRSRLALVAIVDALATQQSFLASVDEVRRAPDPDASAWQLARIYGIGGRRRLLADLMLRAARHEDPASPSAVADMCNLYPAGVTAGDDDPGRKSTYLIGAAFVAPLARAAGLLADKGNGRALSEDDERCIRRAVSAALARDTLSDGPEMGQ